MRFIALSLLALFGLALAAPAHAAPNNEPATLGFSVGYFDINKNSSQDSAVDFRVEYRSAFDMLSLAKAQNSIISVRPFGGTEFTSDGSLYGLGGFVFDVPVGKHFVFSPNVGVGLYYHGGGKRMGSFVEFRSTLEAGYKFDDASRLTVAYGHISNAGLTKLNHGAEILSVYYHLPIDRLFGR